MTIHDPDPNVNRPREQVGVAWIAGLSVLIVVAIVIVMMSGGGNDRTGVTRDSVPATTGASR